MLIKCPECENSVSDKAYSCPHCGYPIKIPSTVKQAPSRSRVRFKRLPSGFGTIKHLSGKRRNPYVAYPSAKEKGYMLSGSPVSRAAIGYYATYQDAYNALLDYNRKPFDVENKSITFAEVHQMFFDEKFKDTSRTYSRASMISAKSGFQNLKAIHDIPIRQLKTYQLQKVMDDCTLKYASLELMSMCLKNVYAFALKNDIIDKNYAQYVVIKKHDDDEKGEPFTEENIERLWERKSDKVAQIALIMIYSGLRIKELETIKIDLANNVMVGGLKTRSGKNRTIPIHPYIKDMIATFNPDKFNAEQYRTRDFYPLLQELNMAISEKGTKHTPHDCRHTFVWLADKFKLDSLVKKMIVGHSLGNDIDENTYGHRTNEELYSEICKITLGKPV